MSFSKGNSMISVSIMIFCKVGVGVTLKEIAAIVGVSVSTVSRVVNRNDPKAASPEVQKKIWAVVREGGYIPNKAARSLKSGDAPAEIGAEPKTIACIYGRTDNTLTDPFFTHIAHSIEQEAFKSNYFVKYSFSAAEVTSSRLHRHLADIQVDGAVVLGRFGSDLLPFLHKCSSNVVYTGLNPVSQPFDQVICEGYDAALAAMHYLQELGHTKIAYLGERHKEIRFYAYKDSLKQQGIEFSSARVVDVIQTSDGGYRGAKELIARNTGITAIFCANDVTAIGVMRALKEHSIHVPQDISVMGIDDIETAQYLSPMLTTIHIPRDELGKIAAQTLMRRIQKLHRLPMRISLPFYLVKRESCRRLSDG